MRRLSVVLLLCAFGMPLIAATTIRLKTKLPEGVAIDGEVVKVKNGYAFRRVAANKVQVYATSAQSRGIVTGAVSCDCHKGSGACDASVTGKGFKCIATGSCTGCTMSISVGNDSKPEVQPVH
jgi:hypothetical protein